MTVVRNDTANFQFNGVQHLAFNHCGLSFRITNAFVQMFMWTAAIAVSWKYALVVAQI
jgi:hypothetical protein